MCLENRPSELKHIQGSQVIPVNEAGQILWHIREDKLTADMDKMKVVMSFENGFKILEKYFYPIQFKSTTDITLAPIVMGFYNNGDENLRQKFSDRTLAYAYPNYGAAFKYSSDMFFNDGFLWAEMNKPNEFNLAKVFVHECLHALGFEHSEIETDILYWQYQSNDEINFSADTQTSIKLRYAAEMAKVPGITKQNNLDTEPIKEFLKVSIKFSEYGLRLPSAMIKNICDYFQLPYRHGLRQINYYTILEYLNK